MAQKVNATAFRLGSTQLWKFETNPSFYTSSNINFLFVFSFLTSEFKKKDLSIVDLKKESLKNNNNLFILLYKTKPTIKNFKKLNFRGLKYTKTIRNNLKKTILTWIEKTLKRKLYVYSNVNNKINSSNDVSIFRLKQKLLNKKILNENFDYGREIKKLYCKKIIPTFSKIGNLMDLKKLSYTLEIKLNQTFKTNYQIQLVDVKTKLTQKTLQLFSKIKRRLKRISRMPLFEETCEIVSISFKFKSPQFLTNYVSSKLSTQKRVNTFLKPLDSILKENFMLQKNLIGLKLQVWGKRFKSGRTKKSKLTCGSLKTSTLRYCAFESLTHAFTKFGTFGIRLLFISKI